MTIPNLLRGILGPKSFFSGFRIPVQDFLGQLSLFLLVVPALHLWQYLKVFPLWCDVSVVQAVCDEFGFVEGHGLVPVVVPPCLLGGVPDLEVLLLVRCGLTGIDRSAHVDLVVDFCHVQHLTPLGYVCQPEPWT